ncbi:MAG TPA: CoA-binding protein, partial [Acidimicrobiia bacterium]|nr:CoA-binding protein [Acidimicrobiia bacterium]
MSETRLSHLFDPRGIIVVGVSSHPAKFGFVALHNILAEGYAGPVFPVNRDGGEILGRATFTDIDEIPAGQADLVVVCTPAAANPDVLRACAAKGVKAAYVVSGGYRETGPEGKQAEDELVALADKLDIALAGPNGQGLISTPSSLCAQIVAPYAVPGAISVVSQSGNTTSSFLNYANQTGVGVARAISAGNAAALSVTDYLEWYRDDPATKVAFTYMEHSADGRAFYDGLRAVTMDMPVVLVKGGVTGEGQKAAASHTGALAGEQRIFTGAVRQAGATLVATVEEGFDVAATFASQPLPTGPNTVVVSTAGGWGVMTADALASSSLRLLPLPDDLRAAIDGKLPPRWSRANPIDMAGGESRDTVPEVLELVASHPDVDAVIFLGMGIQANTARQLRAGGFYPDHGL